MTSIRCISLASSALLLLAAACGGDDDGDGSDGPTFVDSGPTDEPDSGTTPVTCPVDEAIPAITALMDPQGAGQETQAPEDQAEGAPENPQLYYIFGAIGNEDFMEVGLWDGYGVFAETDDKRVAIGEYTIEGEEATVLGCGVCLFLYGNLDLEMGVTDADYIATSGTVNVESITDDLTVTATNITFSQFDSETGEVLADGCSVTVPSISVTAPITVEEQ